MKKINKKLIVPVLFLIVLLAGGVFAFTKFNKPEDATDDRSSKKRITEPVNVIPVEERPVVYIWPVDSKNLKIEVASLNKPANQAEYELEYQAGSLLQGAFDSINLSSVPATAKIMLGSCSAGGACTYHTDIKGGSLLTRFSGSGDSYALKADWKYFENESTMSSKDAKFQIESTALAKQPYVIIFNGYGYPEGLEGQVVSDPYTLTTANAISGKADLTMRASEEEATNIMGWDGEEWYEFEAEVDGKMLTAEVDLMQLYVATKI